MSLFQEHSFSCFEGKEKCLENSPHFNKWILSKSGYKFMQLLKGKAQSVKMQWNAFDTLDMNSSSSTASKAMIV